MQWEVFSKIIILQLYCNVFMMINVVKPKILHLPMFPLFWMKCSTLKLYQNNVYKLFAAQFAKSNKEQH